jgi:HlyD family secretion protein
MTQSKSQRSLPRPAATAIDVSRLGARLLPIAALLVLAVASFGAFMPKAVPVRLGAVERRDLELTVDEAGRTRVRARYVISAPVTGQLERMALSAGDDVEQHAVVARIAPAAPQLLDQRAGASAAAGVAGAKANLNRARSAVLRARTQAAYMREQAERSRMLRVEGGISQQQLERDEYQARAAGNEATTVELAAHVAKHELAAAKAAFDAADSGVAPLRHVDVSAPAAGRVLRVLHESEGLVQAGTPLIELGDPAALELTVDLLTTDAVQIERGAEARIEGWGGPQPLRARVSRIEPAAFTTRSALGVEEQRVSVILDIVDPPERFLALGDGYRAEARIRVADRPQVLAVPESALFRDNDGWAAFVVASGARAKKVAVQLGLRSPDWAEVQAGLAQGDSVVEYPSDQIADGVRVTEAGTE